MLAMIVAVANKTVTLAQVSRQDEAEQGRGRQGSKLHSIAGQDRKFSAGQNEQDRPGMGVIARESSTRQGKAGQGSTGQTPQQGRMQSGRGRAGLPLTDSPNSQSRDKHASGSSDTIGPHHEAEGEDVEADQGTKVEQEVCPLR